MTIRRWVGLGAIAILVAVVATLTVDGGQVGSLGEWVSGLGAAAAVIVAVQELRAQAAEKAQQTIEERDADARRILLRIETVFLDDEGGTQHSEIEFVVSNDSTNPVHNLWLTGRVSRTEAELREGVVDPIVINGPTVGVALALDARRGQGPDDALVEWNVGNLGPGERAYVQVATDLRTMHGETRATWSDIWGQERWSSVADVDRAVTFGVGRDDGADPASSDADR